MDICYSDEEKVPIFCRLPESGEIEFREEGLKRKKKKKVLYIQLLENHQ